MIEASDHLPGGSVLAQQMTRFDNLAKILSSTTMIYSAAS